MVMLFSRCSETIFGNGKPYGKCFLFHLKSSFGFQDIYVFVLVMYKNLIKKIILISNFMTSHLVNKQLQCTYCPRRKDNKKKKLCELIECNMRSIFVKKLYTKCNSYNKL